MELPLPTTDKSIYRPVQKQPYVVAGPSYCVFFYLQPILGVKTNLLKLK